jgi:hypothetical protein
MVSLLELLATAAASIGFIILLRGAWLIVEDKERLYQQRKLKNKGNKCQSDKLTNTQPVENG